MAMYKTRGLRGSALEEMLNLSIEQYRNKNLALIQKIPTPITPVNIDKNSRHITLAYFEKQSTVDYIGVIQGIPVCFDAKECAVDTFPMSNIHEHQIRFMEDFEAQDGIAFLIINYTHKNTTVYLPFKKLMEFYKRSINGGRKSFRFEELDMDYEIKKGVGVPLHFLEAVKLDLERRE